MLKIIIALSTLSLLFLSGCAHSVSLGKNRVTVGSLKVTKSLELIGKAIPDTILMDADENGNAIIYAGKGEIELIPIYLPLAAQTETIDLLKKSIVWGELATKEKVELQKPVGHVSTNSGPFGGTSVLSVQFVSTRDGASWYNRLDFCYIFSKLLNNPQSFKSDPCDKKLTIYANIESVQQLINYLTQTPKYADKAKNAQSKSELFK